MTEVMRQVDLLVDADNKGDTSNDRWVGESCGST